MMDFGREAPAGDQAAMRGGWKMSVTPGPGTSLHVDADTAAIRGVQFADAIGAATAGTTAEPDAQSEQTAPGGQAAPSQSSQPASAASSQHNAYAVTTPLAATMVAVSTRIRSAFSI